MIPCNLKCGGSFRLYNSKCKKEEKMPKEKYCLTPDNIVVQ